MHKHFFAYRQWQNGQPTGIQIEVIVGQNISRAEARRIADEEIQALRDGHQQHTHRALRQTIHRMERSVVTLPDYRFIGAD